MHRQRKIELQGSLFFISAPAGPSNGAGGRFCGRSADFPIAVLWRVNTLPSRSRGSHWCAGEKKKAEGGTIRGVEREREREHGELGTCNDL